MASEISRWLVGRGKGPFTLVEPPFPLVEPPPP
jgi:hypothetical protein